MTMNMLQTVFLAMGLLLISGTQAHAGKITTTTAKQAEATSDSIAADTYFDRGALVMTDRPGHEAESLFPGKSPNLARTHFTWGAEFGSSIDLTGHDLSSFDLDLNLGFKNSFMKIAGVGVGFHRGIESGDTYIPVYGVVRTSFRSRPSLFFLNVQVGYSFNTVGGSKYHGDLMSALGCGINLTQSRMAKSYIILSAGCRYFDRNHKETTSIDTRCITTANIVIGLNF